MQSSMLCMSTMLTFPMFVSFYFENTLTTKGKKHNVMLTVQQDSSISNTKSFFHYSKAVPCMSCGKKYIARSFGNTLNIILISNSYMCFNIPPDCREGEWGEKGFGTCLHCIFFFYAFKISVTFTFYNSRSLTSINFPLTPVPWIICLWRPHLASPPWNCFNKLLTLSLTFQFKNCVFEMSFINQMWISHFHCLCFLWPSISQFIRTVFFLCYCHSVDLLAAL